MEVNTQPSGFTRYPVRVVGKMDDQLSRGLWLVKWFLAIPHIVVLFFLWIAAFFVTVFAWFAILFTGSYPRGAFEFVVGVMRWSWRVNFYALTVLGTDKYPPFTLDHDPEYPATLDVLYPERLSRGLIFVKSWLLALPHLAIITLFQGADSNRWNGWVVIGVIYVLVLFAVVVLLFRGYYPLGMFNFNMGMNRWMWRVSTYCALMRDEYPPFFLDQGEDEPALVEPSHPVVQPGTLPTR